MLGLPGIVLAVVAALVLREPRAAMPARAAAAASESFALTLRTLWGKPTFRYTLMGLTLYGFFAYGVLTFVAAYMVRVLRVDMATVGYSYGALSVATAALGTLGGGWLADRLAQRDRAWLLMLPAAGLLLAFPPYLLGFVLHDFTLFMVLVSVGGVLLTGAIPPVFVAAHAVCGSARRAMAVSILLLFMMLVGSSLGPLAVGLVSDALRPAHGNAGLGHALALLTLVMLACAACFWRGARTLGADAED
jgi:MFS family permease